MQHYLPFVLYHRYFTQTHSQKYSKTSLLRSAVTIKHKDGSYVSRSSALNTVQRKHHALIPLPDMIIQENIILMQQLIKTLSEE